MKCSRLSISAGNLGRILTYLEIIPDRHQLSADILHCELSPRPHTWPLLPQRLPDLRESLEARVMSWGARPCLAPGGGGLVTGTSHKLKTLNKCKCEKKIIVSAYLVLRPKF